jgi:hypothetical protein
MWSLFSVACSIPNQIIGYYGNEAVARGHIEAARRQEELATRSEAMSRQIARDVANLTNRGRAMFDSMVIRDSPGAKVSISIENSFNQTITSEAKSTFDQINTANPQLADNVAAVTALLERSNNRDAWDSWMDFLEEAGKGKRRSKLSAYWDRVVKLVPDVAELVESVAKITAIFTG